MRGNVPPTDAPPAKYPINSSNIHPDRAVGRAFARKVTIHEPHSHRVRSSRVSSTIDNPEVYGHTQTVRYINKPVAPHLAPLTVDCSPTDFDHNPFLKADSRTLKSTPKSQGSGKGRLSVEDAAIKMRSLNQQSPTLTDPFQFEQSVLIGFDQVANYKNQGIPPQYLQKMQDVANDKHVIIAVRPVEKICRTLIEEGYGSKGLHVKGKSANWGPMAGFIPVDQRFSKLAGNPEKINIYNQENHQAIYVNKSVPCQQLHISTDRIQELEGMNILYHSRPITPAAGYSQAIVFEAAPHNGPPETFEAHQHNDGLWQIFSGTGATREKLEVIPLTADFDLLFVHSHYEDVDLGQQDRKRPFHPNLGIVSDKTATVIDALNKKFDRGGPEKNMVHHGADTDNPVTEMAANFPATVVIPEKMLPTLGIYMASPVLIKNEQEMARLYRTLQAAGIRVETNPLWDQLKRVAQEAIATKIKRFGGRRGTI